MDRWYELTRHIMPGMATAQAWPIRYDHCFMRVCLDLAFDRPWHQVVRRPAIRHLTDAQLARAIAIAEHLAAHPDELRPANARSLALRRG